AKAFAELGHPEQRPVYVAVVYVAATLLSACAWPWRRRFRPDGRSRFVGASGEPANRGVRTEHPDVYSVVLGMVIGLVNVGQIWVLLPALAQVPGGIAFP